MSASELEARMYERGVLALGREFERGKLTAEDFARQVMSLAGLEMSYEEFEAEFPDIFTLNGPVARLVAALKSHGYTLLLGSNTNVLHAAVLSPEVPRDPRHLDSSCILLRGRRDEAGACLLQLGSVERGARELMHPFINNALRSPS